MAGRYDEDDCTTLAVAESTTGIISIPEEAAENIKTVGDIIEYVKAN